MCELTEKETSWEKNGLTRVTNLKQLAVVNGAFEPNSIPANSNIWIGKFEKCPVIGDPSKSNVEYVWTIGFGDSEYFAPTVNLREADVCRIDNLERVDLDNWVNNRA